MVNQHPFLFETLAQFDNNIFPFQQHLKVICDILPPLTHACLPPFEQFIEQQIVQLQDYTLEYLIYHTLSNMFSNKTFKAHRVQILSCSGLRVGL
jgi:hypothetical protein